MSKVLIIMSCYGSASDKIQRSVLSVIRQKYTCWTLKIILDGMKLEFDQQFKDLLSDPRIEIMSFKENKGLSYRLATTIENSKHPFVARIDVGDTWHEYKLIKQVEFLKQNTEYMICATNVNYFSKDGSYIFSSQIKSGHSGLMERLETRQGVFEHSTILFRNKLNYRKRMIYAQDLDLYLRLSKLGNLYCLSDSLADIEINLSGISVENKPLQLRYIALAYNDFKNGFVDDVEKLIYQTSFSRLMWNISKIFYKKYIMSRNKFKKIPFLIFALILYPPLSTYYIPRIIYSLKKLGIKLYNT
jgi:teichuronic acid biosynthesis glycosyltransferase TuaG